MSSFYSCILLVIYFITRMRFSVSPFFSFLPTLCLVGHSWSEKALFFLLLFVEEKRDKARKKIFTFCLTFVFFLKGKHAVYSESDIHVFPFLIFMEKFFTFCYICLRLAQENLWIFCLNFLCAAFMEK